METQFVTSGGTNWESRPLERELGSSFAIGSLISQLALIRQESSKLYFNLKIWSKPQPRPPLGGGGAGGACAQELSQCPPELLLTADAVLRRCFDFARARMRWKWGTPLFSDQPSY